jgi:hypothetical protein
VRLEQKNSQKIPKTGQKRPVFKHIGHFLPDFLNAGRNNPAAYQHPAC